MNKKKTRMLYYGYCCRAYDLISSMSADTHDGIFFPFITCDYVLTVFFSFFFLLIVSVVFWSFFENVLEEERQTVGQFLSIVDISFHIK